MNDDERKFFFARALHTENMFGREGDGVYLPAVIHGSLCLQSPGCEINDVSECGWGRHGFPDEWANRLALLMMETRHE